MNYTLYNGVRYLCSPDYVDYFFDCSFRETVTDIKSAFPGPVAIAVFPEAMFKGWGFPNGIAFTSSFSNALLCPTLLHDVGCGFLLFQVTPSPNYPVNSKELTDLVDKIVNGKIEKSIHEIAFEAHRTSSVFDEESLFASQRLKRKGNQFDLTDGERLCLRIDQRIITNSIEIKTIHPLSDRELLSQSSIDKNDLIGFIHSGAYAYKDIIFSRFLEPIIDYCVKNSLFPDYLIAKGIFGVPVTTSIGESLYDLLMALTRHSAKKRLFLYRIISRALEEKFRCRVSMINDVPHSGVFVNRSGGIGKLTVTRGVQLLSQTVDSMSAGLRLIAGQRETISALAIAGRYCAEYDRLVSHGTSCKIASGFQYEEFFSMRERHDHTTWAERASYNTIPDIGECIPFTFNFKIMMEYFEKIGLVKNIAILMPFVNVQNKVPKTVIEEWKKG